MEAYTTDDFLGGLVRLRQPKEGYRATSDAVLLAAAVPAKTGQSVLDVGIGTGAVALCLNARVKGLSITGIDIQDEMIEVAKQNAELNQVSMHLLKGDVANPPTVLAGLTFDHVVTNPPYFTETPQRQNKTVAIAHKENVPLSDWLSFCIKKVKPKGTLTLVHRAERVPEILSLLNPKLGGLILVPFWPRSGKKPKRVLIQGTLGSRKSFSLHPGFILHQDDTTRSIEIEDIMRRGSPLFQS